MATAPFDPINAWPEEEEEPTAFDEMELVAALRREFDAADSEYDRLRSIHNLSHRYYEAQLFGNEVEGRSQIVLPDVQETIDYMAVSVLRTFVSGDRVVEFEATNEDDEHGADDATAAIGYNFMRQQDGYRILHDWCVSGLLERYGVAKTMSTVEEKVTRDRIVITDPVELDGLDAEIEGVEENGDGTKTVSIKQTKRAKKFIDVAVPASEFRFSPNARHEDMADYLAHCPAKTRSDLCDMGFDQEQVYSLPAYTKLPEEDRAEFWPEAESTTALEKVLLCEEYARIDIDGDGIAERVKVFRVDNEILKWADGSLAVETVEDQPFTIFSPFPRPHRIIGWSLADKVMDLQLASSTIARQLLDGMYNSNMPRPVVDMAVANDPHTIEDLLSPVPGSPIRARGGAASVQPYQTGFDVAKSLNVLEWIRGERESRTGITRLNQGLDADALNKTATGTAMMQAQGQQQEEFIARNLAEAFGRLMAKKYRLMKTEADTFRIKVDGQYKEVNPAEWPDEINVTIRVGLGSGSKDKRIQYRMMVAPIMAEGQQSGQVSHKNVFNMFDGLVRDMGLGQGDDYWIDPDSEEGQQAAQEGPKPDPAMLELQMKQQQAAQQQQLDQQATAAKLDLQQQESSAKIDIMHNEGQQKIQLEATKAATAQQLAEQKAAFEADLARQTADRNYEIAMMQEANRHELALRQADHAHEMAKQKEAHVPQERPGGDLDK